MHICMDEVMIFFMIIDRYFETWLKVSLALAREFLVTRFLK